MRFWIRKVCSSMQAVYGEGGIEEVLSHLSLLGFQGLLSFLSAPLIGALSDVWGRKSFLLLTVFFTCAPIPLMKISPW